MQELIYRKENFDLSESLRYELSIQVGLDGFLFLVKELDVILLFNRYEASLSNENLLLRTFKAVCDNLKFQEHAFLKTEIYLSNPGFALIPQPFFSEKLASGILSGDKRSIPGSEAIVMPLESLNASLTFMISSQLLSYIRELHPGCLVGHEVSLLLQNFGKRAATALHIHLHDTWFYALSVADGMPRLVNTYEYHSPDDLLFFVLSLLTLPEFKDFPVFLSGSIEEDDVRFSVLSKHLPQVEIFRQLPGSDHFRSDAAIPFSVLPGITLL